MSETNCEECGHPTEWVQDIGSAVCTQCGTLADPAQQSSLASPLDSFPCDVPSYAPRTTLKSIRRNAAWDLPGQSSNSRNDRNKVLSLFYPFSPSQTIALLSSLFIISSAHLLTVWDIMVWHPVHKLFSTPRCSALP